MGHLEKQAEFNFRKTNEDCEGFLMDAKGYREFSRGAATGAKEDMKRFKELTSAPLHAAAVQMMIRWRRFLTGLLERETVKEFHLAGTFLFMLCPYEGHGITLNAGTSRMQLLAGARAALLSVTSDSRAVDRLMLESIAFVDGLEGSTEAQALLRRSLLALHPIVHMATEPEDLASMQMAAIGTQEHLSALHDALASTGLPAFGTQEFIAAISGTASGAGGRSTTVQLTRGSLPAAPPADADAGLTELLPVHVSEPPTDANVMPTRRMGALTAGATAPIGPATWVPETGRRKPPGSGSSS